MRLHSLFIRTVLIGTANRILFYPPSNFKIFTTLSPWGPLFGSNLKPINLIVPDDF